MPTDTGSLCAECAEWYTEFAAHNKLNDTAALREWWHWMFGCTDAECKP